VRELLGVRGAQHFAALAAVQGANAVAAVWLSEALGPGRSWSWWLLGGAGIAWWALFWRGCAPTLERLGLERVPRLSLRGLLPLALAWVAAQRMSGGWIARALGLGMVALSAVIALAAARFVLRERARLRRAKEAWAERKRREPGAASSRVDAWLDWSEGASHSAPPEIIRGSYFPGIDAGPLRDAADIPGLHARCREVIEAARPASPEVTELVVPPGRRLAPAPALGNLELQVLCPAEVPEGAFLEVQGARRPLVKAEPLVFDPSYGHSLDNRGAGPLVVRSFKVPQPRLTPLEREFLASVGALAGEGA
jgi:hypothetical protein